ncbi:MAG TPA: NAD(P)-dependent oxidoreductase [Candidatus Dormibacteraeota bacterium]|nr:NAD(P)-dependent oxidoreductase [Candidatus Dormibacteraeota bacterium]
MTAVGVVGLGVMGRALSRRLLATGHEVRGHDVSPEATRQAAALGVEPTSLEALTDLEMVLTSLPDDDVVSAVLQPPGGLVARLRQGATIVELSTVLPRTVRAADAAARLRGVRLVDCAVSGGPAEAASGSLVLLVGARDEDLERARPLLESLGTIQHAGAVGDGKTVKLVNNVMTMGNVLIAAEAFTLGVRSGIEPRRLFQILAASGGRSHHFLKRFPYLLDRDFEARFSLRLGEKDLRLALALAEEAGAALPATAVVHQLYRSAIALGSPEEDIVAVARFYERLAGLELAGREQTVAT